MTRRLSLLFFPALALVAQRGGGLPDPFDNDAKLPNGKSRKDAIVKQDHKRNQEDSVALATLSAEVREELAAQESNIVSAKMIKKLEEIERLSRGIRGRLKRL